MTDGPEQPTAPVTSSYQFQGRITPSLPPVTIKVPLEVILTYAGRPPFKLSARIDNSIVTVDCESEPPRTREIQSDAYFGALNLVHNVVDLVSFHKGCALTVVLDTWTDPDGVTQAIGPLSFPDLVGINTAFDVTTEMAPALRLLFAEPQVWDALHDLTQGLRHRMHTVLDCGRDIDAVKHLIAPGDMSDKAKWNAMNDALNLTEAYCKVVSDAAKNPRHGRRGHITPETQVAVATRSWTIMSRYFEYRLRNSGPLREPDFPLLTG